MDGSQRSSISLAFLLLASSLLAAFVPTAAADSRILLDLSEDHVILLPGAASNVTLTVHNNNTSIADFDLAVDASGTPLVWNVTLADEHMSQMIPTFSDTTTVIIRLDANATMADHSSVDLVVSHSGENVSSRITLYLSVAPQYEPWIGHHAVGDSGLITMPTNSSIDVDVSIENRGSAMDHLILSVDDAGAMALGVMEPATEPATEPAMEPATGPIPALRIYC